MKLSSPFFPIIGVASLVVILVQPNCSFGDQTWDNGNGNFSWNDPVNWTTAVPGAADIVTLPVVIPPPSTSPQTINLTAGSLASSMIVNNNYNLSGGDLSLTSGGIFTNVGSTLRLDSQLIGSTGLNKTGLGTLVLTNVSNNYTGTTTISLGTVVVNGSAAFGSSTTTIVVSGNAGSQGQSGGQLIVDGGYAGTNFTRNLSISGGGPAVGSAFVTVGNNTFSGTLTTTSAATVTRLYSIYGTSVISGAVTIAAGQTLEMRGAGNWEISGNIGTTTGILTKTGETGTLILSGTNTYSGVTNINSGFLRVSTAANLGTGTLQFNGGTLELRTDAPNFGTKNIAMAGGSGTVFADHAIGSSLLNQTIQFGTFNFADNDRNPTITGRNGTGVTFGTGTGTFGGGGDGPSTMTTTANGLFTVNAAGLWNTADTGAGRTFTLAATGDMLVTANILASGNRHVFTKSNTGTLTITSSASTYLGNTFVSGGTLVANNIGALGDPLAALDFNSGTFVFAGTAGVTTAKEFNLFGATAPAYLFANQTGGALVLQNSIGAGGAGSKTLVLGGSSTQLNEIQGYIDNNSATNVTSLLKMGAGTWIYGPNFDPVAGSTVAASAGPANQNLITVSSTSGLVVGQSVTNGTSATPSANIPAGAVIAEIVSATQFRLSNNVGTTAVTAGDVNIGALDTFTGNITIVNGLLGLKATSATRNIINNTSSFTFTADGLAPGLNTQSAGGILDYLGFSTGSAESVGALIPAAGAATVRVTPGASGLSQLTFASLGTVTLGSSVNFVIATGGGGTGEIVLTGASGFVNPRLYFGGSDFAFGGAGAVLRAPIYGTDAGFVTSATALSPTTTDHNEITGSFATGAPFTIASLKINGAQTLTLGGDLTIGGATGGGIIQTGGSGAIAGAFGITTASTGDLVVRVTGAGDVLTLSAPVLASTTGGLTKNGAGTLVLSAPNTYVGTTTINEGILQIQSAGRLGGASASNNNNLAVRQGATLDLNGINIGVAAFNGAGTITNSNVTAATLTIGNNNQSGVFSGILQNGIGVLGVTKGGTGTTMSLTGLNTYTGITTLNAGTLVVNTLANIGTASSIGRGDNTSAATNAASLVFAGGTLQYSGANAQIFQATQTPSISIDRLFTLAGNGIIDSSGQFGNNVLATGTPNNATLIFSNTAAVAFSGAGARTLTLQGNSTGDNRINIQLINNTNAGEALNLTKAGAGLWILGNSGNSYTGTTTISAGALQAIDGTTLPTNSPLALNGGVLQTSGNFVRGQGTSSGQVTWNAGGGFSASDSKLVVAIGGTGSPTALTWGSGGFLPSGNLILSSLTALAEVEFRNAIALGAAVRTIQVDDNTTTSTDFATVSGLISGGAGGILTKTGAGSLILSGANTYSGGTSHTAGTLFVYSIGGSTSASSGFGANSTLTLGNAGSGTPILTYVGAGETSDRLIRLNSTTGAITIDSSGSGALVLTNLVNDMLDGNKTLILRGYNTDNNEITSVLTNRNATTLAVTHDTSGTWILSGNNTYTGATTLTNSLTGAGGAATNTVFGTGLITMANAGIFALNADRTLPNGVNFNNATGYFEGEFSITFNGASSATNNGGVIFNRLVAGKTLTFTGPFTLATESNQGRTFTVSGPGTTILSGIIADGPGTGAENLTLNATGGTLRLTGIAPNTYTGTTTVTVGTLELDKVGALGTGTLAPNGGVVTSPNTDLVFANGVALGGAATFTGVNSLTFANLSQSGASRNLDNNIAAGDTLTFTGTVSLQDTTNSRTLSVRGSGTTIFSGKVQNGGTAVGSLNVNGAGAILILSNPTPNDNNYTGNTTITQGTLRLGATEVISNAALTGNNVAISPAAGQSATLDLNGFNETINGLTANSAGTSIIDNSAATVASLIFGANNTAVTFGAATGTFQIKNTGGGALSIIKIGTAAATIGNASNLGITLTYTGSTSVTAGTMSVLSPLNGTTTLNAAGTGSILNISNTVTGPSSVTASAAGVINLSAAAPLTTTAGATISVTGAGSALNASASVSGGPGTISIANGGAATFASLATAAGASISVTDAGSTLNVNGNVTGGPGSISVANGALANFLASLTVGSNASLSVTGASSALNLTGPLTNAASFSSVTVGAGATLNVMNNAATPFTNLTTMNLGAGAGIATLSLDIGSNANSDKFTTSGAAVTANSVRFNLNSLLGFGTSSVTLLSAASGLSAATYSVGTGPLGYTYSFTTSDTSVILNFTPAGLINIFWKGGIVVASPNSWSALGAGSISNWTSDQAGTLDAASLPGAVSTVTFSAATATGPAIATTLDASFVIHDLIFSAVPTGVTSVSIAPGTSATNSLTVSPTISNLGIEVQASAGAVTISAPFVAGANQTWSVSAPTASLTISGAFSGTGNITKTGAGTAIISGLSTGYTGAFTLDQGTLSLRANGTGSGVAIPFGNNANVTVIGNSTLDVREATFNATNTVGSVITLGSLTVGPNNLTITGSTTVTAGTAPTVGSFGLYFTGPTTIDGNATFTMGTSAAASAPATLLGAVTGTGTTPTITIAGPATTSPSSALRLPNMANTFAAGTTFNLTGGNLEITQVVGGAGDGTTSIGAAPVTLAGGTLRISPSLATTLTGTNGFSANYYNFVAAPTDTATTNYLALPNGANTTGVINAPSNTAGLVPGAGMTALPAGVSTFNVGALYRGVLTITTSGYYGFNLSSDDGSQLFIDGALVVNNNPGTHGVPGQSPWGTIFLSAGQHLISERFLQGTSSGATVLSYQGADTAGSLVLVGSIAGSVINPASLPTVTLSNVLTLGAGTSGLEVAVNTIIPSLTSTAAATLNFSSTNLNTITIPGAVTMGGNLTLGVNSSTLLLNGILDDGAGTFNFTKAGNGLAVVTAPNTYGGTTSVTGGVLRGVDGVGLQTTSLLTLNGGVFETSVDFQRTLGAAAGNMQITGGASGFSANGANIQVAFGTIASPATLTWGGATFNPGTLILNAFSATNMIDFKNPLNLNNAVRTIAVNSFAPGTEATLSATITGGGTSSGLTKTGPGTLNINNVVTTLGALTVNDGTLNLNTSVSPTGAFNLTFGNVNLASGTTLSLVGGVNHTIGNAHGVSTLTVPAGSKFAMTPGAGNMMIGFSNTATGLTNAGILDASAATGTDAVVISVATLGLGAPPVTTQVGVGQGTLRLPTSSSATSSITATVSVLIGNNSNGGQSAVTSLLDFGGGTTTIDTPILTVGGLKSNGSLLSTTPGGTLILKNGAAGKVNLNIGDNNVSTGTQSVGIIDSTGSTLTATLGTVIMGRVIGNAAASTGNGSFIVDGSSSTVTLDSMTLATRTTNGTATGTFTIKNGTVTFNTPGGDGITVGTAPAATSVSNVNIQGGILDMNAKGIAVVSNITFTGGTLKNASTIGQALTQTSATGPSLLLVESTKSTAITGAYTANGGVNTATARVDGTLTATSGVTIGGTSAATLQGTGTVGSTTAIGSFGTIKGGNLIGTLSIGGNLTSANNSQLNVDFSHTGGNSLINITGGNTYSFDPVAGNKLIINLTGSLDDLPGTPYTITLVQTTNTSGIVFNGTPQTGNTSFGSPGANYTLNTSNFANVIVSPLLFVSSDGRALQLSFTAAVPEPHHILLMCVAVLGLGFYVRRRLLTRAHIATA